MTTMLIANNCTRESGSFMGDQLCSLKTAYLFVENQPDVDKVLMSVSPINEMHFLWTKFIERYNVELIPDNWNPGDWESRFSAWNTWRKNKEIEGRKFDHYRELHLRIHGQRRQMEICGSERGLGRKNIYEYWFYGQENMPETCVGSDWYDDTLVHHPPHTPTRDVYISPHAKTQGNFTFTFDFWADVVHKLIDAGVTVTVGYNGYFCEDLINHPLYRKHWGDHKQWMEQVCSHKLVACGNTGTGWLAAACGVPMITMEPINSQMPDHRYRECGLKNIVELVDTPDAEYVAKRIIEETKGVVVMTTGCYDVLHAGHVRHLERSKALGTKLIVAMNSDTSVKALKGQGRPINPQNQRKSVLEALRCVDEVRVFDGPNALSLIQEIKPKILTVGFGYEEKDIVGRDLVERAVVTCRGDASNEPSTTKIVKRYGSADLVEVCRLGCGASCNPFDKMKLMAEQLLSVADVPGAIADLGTCRGGTGLVLRRLAPLKKLYMFDTWNGNPHDDPLCHHKKGEWKATLDDCFSVVGFTVSGLTHYIEGVFPQSAEGLDINLEKFSFVYVDMDTYQSTKDSISFFWPLMESGGKIVFDDYNWEPCAGVKKAVDEFGFLPNLVKVIGTTYIVEKM